MTSLRRMAATALTAVAVFTGTAVIAGPAHAYNPDVPPCFASGCLGKNPHTLRNQAGISCADNSYWVKDKNTSTGYAMATADGSTYDAAVLVYSPWCQSNWVEFIGDWPYCGASGLWYVEQNNGVKGWPIGDGSSWSKMVNGTGVAQAWVWGGCAYENQWVSSGWF